MRLVPAPRWTAGCTGLLLSVAACHPVQQSAAPMFTDDNGRLSVPAHSPLRSHLTIAPVSAGGSAATIELPATVEADPARITNILAPLTGRITALEVHIGEHVRRGQVLAVLASGDFAQALADDDKARDAFDLANRTLQRTRIVQDAGGSATKDVEAAQSGYRQAQAELLRAQSRLQSLNGPRTAARSLELVAPQSGVVTSLAIGAGAQIGDPTATLMTITNIDRVFVTANVAQEDVGKTPPGTPVDITLDGDRSNRLHGTIGEIDAVVQPDTRRQKVRIALSNPDGRLLPNMYATVRVTVPASQGIYVPQSALLMNNDTVSVLTEVRPWVFERRPVEISDETDTTAHIVQGLAAGEHIVTRGGVLLDD